MHFHTMFVVFLCYFCDPGRVQLAPPLCPQAPVAVAVVARPANVLYKACKYVAQGLRIECAGPADCTGPANMLHRACKYIAKGLQMRCTGPANLMHAACTYTAQGLQICCTGSEIYCTDLVNMLHTACKYNAQGLQGLQI